MTAQEYFAERIRLGNELDQLNAFAILAGNIKNRLENYGKVFSTLHQYCDLCDASIGLIGPACGRQHTLAISNMAKLIFSWVEDDFNRVQEAGTLERLRARFGILMDWMDILLCELGRFREMLFSEKEAGEFCLDEVLHEMSGIRQRLQAIAGVSTTDHAGAPAGGKL